MLTNAVHHSVFAVHYWGRMNTNKWALSVRTFYSLSVNRKTKKKYMKQTKQIRACTLSFSCSTYHPRYYVDGKTFIFLSLFPLTECLRVLFPVYISTRLYRIHSIYFSLLFEFHFYLYYVLITFWWFFTSIFLPCRNFVIESAAPSLLPLYSTQFLSLSHFRPSER